MVNSWIFKYIMFLRKLFSNEQFLNFAIFVIFFKLTGIMFLKGLNNIFKIVFNNAFKIFKVAFNNTFK